MTAPIKEGIRTSEFWLSVAADVAATVLLAMHRITPAEWTLVTGGSASVYSLARSVVKGTASSAAISAARTIKLSVPASSGAGSPSAAGEPAPVESAPADNPVIRVSDGPRLP